MKKSAQKHLFNILGGIFVALGIAGIVLPLVPTTPFLLLAAYCLSKGSPRFHHWLIHHKHLGPSIRDWEQRGVIRRTPKILATVMLLISAGYIYPNPAIPLIGKISFAILKCGVLLFVWSRPSI